MRYSEVMAPVMIHVLSPSNRVLGVYFARPPFFYFISKTKLT